MSDEREARLVAALHDWWRIRSGPPAMLGSGRRKIRAMRSRQCRCDRAATRISRTAAEAVDLRRGSPCWSQPLFCYARR
jgi:hypothetical protein